VAPGPGLNLDRPADHPARHSALSPSWTPCQLAPMAGPIVTDGLAGLVVAGASR